MSNKTRVLNVRVVGFSAPERQMLNSIFLLSVAPARQIGYKLWNPETGTAPDMYLLDGDSESAVASWQATFASTSDRTLVVGSKNLDLGVASASRPLGLKVVGAMDRLAIALNNVEKETAKHQADGLDVSAPTVAGKLLQNAAEAATAPKQEQTIAKVTSGMTARQPALSSSMNAALPAMSANASTLSSAVSAAASTMSNAPSVAASTMSSAAHIATAAGSTLSSAAHAVTMTAAAPAATVLPNVTLQPNVSLDRSLNEKPVTEKTVDKILSDNPAPAAPTVNLQSSGVTPLSPSALSAAVAPSTTRTNLRVVTNPPAASPMSASLPAVAPASARLADAPLNNPVPPATPLHARLADAPMQPPPTVSINVVPPPAPVVPVGAPPQLATQAPTQLASHAPPARYEEHNFRVLVVDDSPLMRTFMQNKLSPYGVQPEFAASGEEALFKISKLHFDMIFLDVMLPGMDGYDVCKMIKKNKDNALMKVVMLTSKDKTFDKIRGTMAGCDGYLTKPVDEMKLRAIIERHSVAQK